MPFRITRRLVLSSGVPTASRSIEPTRPGDAALLVVAAMSIALASPLAKAVVGLGPLGVGAGRCAVGSALLFLLAPRLTLRSLATLTPKGASQLAVVGVLLAAHFACFLWGLSLTSLPAAVSLVSLEPLAVVLLSWFAFRMRPRGLEMVGLAVAVAGALVIAQGAGHGENRLIGDVLVVFAVVLYGAYVAAARGLQHLLPVVPYAAAVYGVAAISLVPFAIGEAGGVPHPPARTLLLVVLMGLLPTLVGHTLIQRLARRLSPSVVALVPVGETVGSIAIGVAFQGFVPTAAEWVGALAILGGAVVVSRANVSARAEAKG
ncbi:MAG: DMT family transporter [Myxococcales bacterium]|nr:DMT family transporter [Myxococcales bacterium]